jgi:hypothetical protein
MRRNLRYLILLSILLFVAVNEALMKMRSTSWENPLWVRIYAVNGDGRSATDAYIDSLTSGDFQGIEKFVNFEARRYGISIDAIDVEYQGRLDSHPPQPPTGESIPENMWWSLAFRAWAWRRAWSSSADEGDVELFVSYHDTATTDSLRHSVGLRGGMIGIINGFAHDSYRGSNNVVIIHELMHTLGATDKYDAGGMPQHPAGFAEPYRSPLFPQQKAEIMGGRIPLSENQSRMPESLKQVVIGPITAIEINWPGARP